MKLQRTVSCIAGALILAGFAASEAVAGSGFPGCTPPGLPNEMLIEVNALRAGGKTITTSPNGTTKVTAKARIEKGTAPPGTTIVTTLRIQAFDGPTLLDEQSQGNITLGVGKGGKGGSLDLATNQCVSGFLTFKARFKGPDSDGEDCIGTREIRKACK